MRQAKNPVYNFHSTAATLPRRQPLKDGAAVFAVVSDHELYPAKVDESIRRGRVLGPGNIAVRFLPSSLPHSGQAYAVPDAETVPAEGYWERLVDGCVTGGQSVNCELRVWRVQTHKEGLFSLLFWALGCMERWAAEAPHGRFLVDWTDERICFHGSAVTTTTTAGTRAHEA